jgi:hypothetical protein
MKSLKQIRSASSLNEASVHLDNPFDSKHGTDHKTEKKHADMMKKNHGVTTKYHRDSGEMSYHGPKTNLKAALHTHYRTDNAAEIKDNHPELFEEYGAGEFGTAELTNKYKNATPGQSSNVTEENNFKVTFAHEHPEGEKKHEYVVKAKNQNDADHRAIALHQKAHPNGKFTLWDSQLMHEEVLEACWDSHKQVGMKMKDGRKVPNCVPKEGAEEDMAKHHAAAQVAKKAGDNDAFHKHMDAKFEIAKNRDAKNAKKPIVKFGENVDTAGGTDLNEMSNFKKHSSTAALHSQAAKNNPSIATHVKAANSHEKASQSHSRKLDKLIRNKAPAADLVSHETMVKQHDRQVIVHKIMAHRLIKKHMSEAVEIDESIDAKKNEKITKHSAAAVAASKRGDKNAQQFHLAIVSKLKNESAVKEATEETDGEEEISMAKNQLLKIVDMAKDLSDAMDDHDELEAWIQSKITTAYNELDDVHSYVEYDEDLQDKKYDSDEKNIPMDESVIAEEIEDGEETAGMSDEEKKSLARLQTLIRLGLLDRQRLPIISRAIKKLDTESPINNFAEKLALFELLQRLIAVITGDTSVFAKVRSLVVRK